MAEVGIAVASDVASKVADSLFRNIKRNISYVFKYQSYVDKLRSQLVVLKDKRQRVEQAVKDAENQGDEIYDDVQRWLTAVTVWIERVEKSIDEEEDNAKNKRCFMGLCPNLMTRHKLSKEAVKDAEDVVDFLGNGNFSNVSYCPAPETIELRNAVRDYQQFDSRMKIFQDVMDALEDSMVKMVGVYGMGGVGKTTLAQQIKKKVKEEKLIFDEVAMAEVTQTPDLKIIQDKIAADIGLKFDQNENVYDRANQLCRRLKKQKKVLVILDNIWGRLDLENIGIPLGDDKKEGEDVQRRCTIMLTSRSQHVLCNDMNSEKNFSIEVLSDEEAKSLFWKTVDDHSMETLDFQSLAVGIVGKCGGLPIAIKTIASALKNKRLPIWKDALYLLNNSNPRQIQGMDKNVYASIKLSYNFLESEEAKSLFRLCGLLNDGSRISINNLMSYGMGLGMFTNVYTLEVGRNRVDTLIDNLKASCLLLDGDIEDEVKMHDIIHVVAESIATDELMFNIHNVDDLTRVLENTRQNDPVAISLPYRDVQELPERLKCRRLKLFLLFANNRNSLQIPNHFFAGMEELKVLHLSQIPFPTLPSSLDCLINLQTLSLIRCPSLEDVAIIGELKKLEFLSLQGSDIKQLPAKIGQLIRLKQLDLSNCLRLKVIAPNIISKLSQLEELYMGNSFTQWEKGEEGSNASLVELKALSKLTTLEIHIRDPKIITLNLFSKGLERFKIFIGEKWDWRDWYHKYQTSRTLKLSGLDKKIFLGNIVKLLLKRVEDLSFSEPNDFQNIVHELEEDGFPQLRHLHLQNSPEILYIVNLEGRVCCNAFPVLQSLLLDNLINLEKICHGQLMGNQSFSRLKIIKVSYCDRLQHLIPFHMVKNFLWLQKIKVTDCKNLKSIVGEERESHIVNKNESINFTQLHSLTLATLPQLIGTGFNVETSQTLATLSALKEIIAENDPRDFIKVLFNNKVTFPTLEKLKLDSLNIEKIWLDQFPTMSTCQNLTKMMVYNCNHLKFLFPYSLVNSLLQLQQLVIKDCESMESIIDIIRFGRDEEQMIEVIAFPKLNRLELSNLPRLTQFISISSIEENTVLHTNTNMRPLFDEKVGLPSLEELNIRGMNKLRRIWHPQLDLGSFSNLKNFQVENCAELINIFPMNIITERRLERLEKLSIRFCSSIEEIIEKEASSNCTMEGELLTTGSRFDVFPQLTRLDLFCVPNLRSIYQGIHILEWPMLKNLDITHCETVEMLFGSSKLLSLGTNSQQPIFLVDHHKVGLPSLEVLNIRLMNKLRRIWHPQLDLGSFSNLKNFQVENCAELINIFPSNVITKRRLESLEKLSIRFCNSIEEIIQKEASSNCTMEGELLTTSSRFDVFPQLTILDLWNLPNFRSVYQGIHILEWPMLKNLEIRQCEKVEMLFGSSKLLSLETDSQQPIFLVDHHKVALPSLSTLSISYCDRLRNLVTHSTIENLVKLTSIKIEECRMIEEIVQQIGEETKEDPIVFSQLKDLTLSHLPKFKHFCVGNYTLEFPNLEKVRVMECPRMKVFSRGVLHTPNLHKVQFTHAEDEERWEGNLNFTIQKMFEEMVALYYFYKLKLSEFPYVKEIWHDQTLPVSFFCNLRELVVDDCKFMLSAIPANLLQFLKNLHTLEVRNCDSVEQVFCLEELNDNEYLGPLFSKLKTLALIDLPKLKRFCSFTGNIIELPKLSNLLIENCPIMERFISNSTPLHMTVNKEPPEVISNENFLVDDMQPFFDGKIAFPDLGTLKLSKLSKLLHMCKENSHPTSFFQKLMTLEISECSKLEQLVPSLVFFQNLKTLKVSKCEGLKNLLALSTVESLVKLESMSITDCQMMEGILQPIREDVKEIPIVFSKLNYLELNRLPSLESFCSGNYTFEFPSLELVLVIECPKMKIFSPGVLSTPELEILFRTELEDEEGHWEGSLNSTIRKLFEEMNVQSSKNEE